MINKAKWIIIILVVSIGLFLGWFWYNHSVKHRLLTAEQAVVEKFQCYRCHEMQAPFDQHTVDVHFNCRLCHQDILQGKLDADYSAEAVAKWKQHIRHFTEVPALIGLSQRLQRQWFIDYVQNPTVIRPHLLSMMPRLPISKQEAMLLADYFSLSDTDMVQKDQQQGNATRGEKLFNQKGCNSCHLFSSPQQRPQTYPHFDTVAVSHKAKRNAPDLRDTQQRMSAQQITQWLRNPQQLKADTLMPKIKLTETEIAHLVRYLTTPKTAQHKMIARFTPIKKPEPLTRPVRYQEVEKKVFKALCWHCHSDPKGNWGDGGAGNTGGFGYAGAGLDLGSYETVVRGSKQADGNYRSILRKGVTGETILVQHLLARHNEMRGYRDPTIMGMPLALPPLSMEHIQLIVTWIEQGAQK